MGTNEKDRTILIDVTHFTGYLLTSWDSPDEDKVRYELS